MQKPNPQDGCLKRFSDFAEEPTALEGNKVAIDSVLNKEIVITGYRVGKTKYERGSADQCLTLEFVLEGEKRVIFTGSNVLIEQMEKYGKEIPFITEITKINKYYRLK